MKLLYFAWLRQRTGTGAEDVELPAGVTTVGELVEHLRGQDTRYVDAFADMGAVRAAVNQEYVPLDFPIGNGDEVAFFPPVTGG